MAQGASCYTPTLMSVEVIFLGVSAALPHRDTSNAAYLVRIGNERILVDCGPCILQQLDAIGVSPAELTHVFFTHRHGDHTLGYPMLMLWYELQENPALAPPTLIASAQTFAALDALMNTAFGTVEGVTESAPRIVLPQDAPGEAQIHPHIRLRTFPMQHSDFAPVLGLRIETRGPFGEHAIAFTGDTLPNPNIALLAQDADLLVHEATLCATLEPQFAEGAYGHSTAQSAGRNARLARARRLALTHIEASTLEQRQLLIEEAQREFDGPVFIQVPGLRLVL